MAIKENLKQERLGLKKKNPKGYMMEIIEYRKSTDIDIRFENGEIIEHTNYARFKSGNICLPSEAPIRRKQEMHGERYTKLWKEWNTMLWRCNPKNKRHHVWYSDLGIKVCDEWQRYTNFRDWALSNGFKEYLTIDRIDEEKDYSPSNCRWITKSENVARINRNKKWIPIDKYDLEGNFIEHFNNKSRASRSVGDKTDSNITKCCNGEIKNYKGYVWKYANK